MQKRKVWFCLLPIVMFLAIAVYSASPNMGMASWACSLLVLSLAFVALGIRNCKRWDGILIDTRNVLSLSRLQMAGWTILVLGTLLALAFHNLFVCPDAALNINLPEELLWAMGISTGSLAGSALIVSQKQLDTKDDRKTDNKGDDKNLAQGQSAPTTIDPNTVKTFPNPAQARWSDLLTGELTGNFNRLDLSRVQMLFLTLLIWLVYGVMIGNQFHNENGLITHFPPLSSQLIGLFTISQLGYLTTKTLSQSPSAG